jgi:hypothetical protein
MTWRDILRDHDPAAEAALGAEDAQSIRRTVVAAAQQRRSQQHRWVRPAAVAAMLMLIAASGIYGGRRPQPQQSPIPETTGSEERRQLQFSTPGGTRIIWTFNPQLDLNETQP